MEPGSERTGRDGARGLEAYLEATARIPAGRTRTFMELAELAGRPGAARAAGRAVAACGLEDARPWHRVVASSGRAAQRGERGREQLRRLRREGARPGPSEPVADWARRVGAERIGHYGRRVHYAPDDPRVARCARERLEPLSDLREARARGFRDVDAPPEPPAPLPAGRGDAPRSERPLETRLDEADWPRLRERLRERGVVRVPKLLAPAECADLLEAGRDPDRLERTVEMRGGGFGRGIYHYWREPPPEPAASLRAQLYARLRPLAEALRRSGTPPYPDTLETFHERCREAGQHRGSALLLRYGEEGVNHPHRDLYGPVWFPLQATVVLARRGDDFDGGCFYVLDEGADEPAPAQIVAGTEGDLVLFASRERWESGADGHWRRIPLRHGMTAVTRGRRFALGLVFHLAR